MAFLLPTRKRSRASRPASELPIQDKLGNSFNPRAASDALPDIEELPIPDVATDVSSTYLRLHAKRHIYAEDEDFRIVKDALSELRGSVHRKRLHKMTTDPPKIRQLFKEKSFGTIHFNVSKSPDEATGAQEGKAARPRKETLHLHHPDTWRAYYVKLLVLAQARRWLSSTEQLLPIADAPSTPKTNFQLADAIKHSDKAEYAPFGVDFEDAGAYSPVISRLLFYAEIHNCSDHGYGKFSAPKQMPPYTYTELQRLIIERRRQQQPSDDVDKSSRELVQTAADLATRLCAFASDGIVVRHLVDFALPPNRRAKAAEVTALDEMMLQSTGRGAATEHTAASGTATEHTEDDDGEDKQADNQRRGADTGHTAAGGAATEHTEDNYGDDKQADNQREAISVATEHTSKPVAADFFNAWFRESL